MHTLLRSCMTAAFVVSAVVESRSFRFEGTLPNRFQYLCVCRSCSTTCKLHSVWKTLAWVDTSWEVSPVTRTFKGVSSYLILHTNKTPRTSFASTCFLILTSNDDHKPAAKSSMAHVPNIDSLATFGVLGPWFKVRTKLWSAELDIIAKLLKINILAMWDSSLLLAGIWWKQCFEAWASARTVVDSNVSMCCQIGDDTPKTAGGGLKSSFFTPSACLCLAFIDLTFRAHSMLPGWACRTPTETTAWDPAASRARFLRRRKLFRTLENINERTSLNLYKIECQDSQTSARTWSQHSL